MLAISVDKPTMPQVHQCMNHRGLANQALEATLLSAGVAVPVRSWLSVDKQRISSGWDSSLINKSQKWHQRNLTVVDSLHINNSPFAAELLFRQEIG